MTWELRPLCKCGKIFDAPLAGRIWFTQQIDPVCPRCGSPASSYRMETVRYVSHGWFKGGHWENKDGALTSQHETKG